MYIDAYSALNLSQYRILFQIIDIIKKAISHFLLHKNTNFKHLHYKATLIYLYHTVPVM